MGAARLVSADVPPERLRPVAGRHASGGARAAEGWDVEEGWGAPGGPGRPAPGRGRDRAGADRRRAGSGPRRPGPGRAARAGPGRDGRDPGNAVRVRLPLWDRMLRGLAGVLAGGLLVLSVGLLGVWLLAGRWGVPGPGGFTVFGHLLGAVVAVAGQRIADRRPDRTGTLAAVLVIGAATLVLGLAWFL